MSFFQIGQTVCSVRYPSFSTGKEADHASRHSGIKSEWHIFRRPRQGWETSWRYGRAIPQGRIDYRIPPTRREGEVSDPFIHSQDLSDMIVLV